MAEQEPDFRIVFFRSALRAFQRHLFHGFQLEAVLEHHGHFVAAPIGITG